VVHRPRGPPGMTYLSPDKLRHPHVFFSYWPHAHTWHASQWDLSCRTVYSAKWFHHRWVGLSNGTLGMEPVRSWKLKGGHADVKGLVANARLQSAIWLAKMTQELPNAAQPAPAERRTAVSLSMIRSIEADPLPLQKKELCKTNSSLAKELASSLDFVGIQRERGFKHSDEDAAGWVKQAEREIEEYGEPVEDLGRGRQTLTRVQLSS